MLMNNFDFIKILRILSQKVAHTIAALYFVQIWSLTILSLKFEQFKFWNQYLQNIEYMVKQRGRIDTNC